MEDDDLVGSPAGQGALVLLKYAGTKQLLNRFIKSLKNALLWDGMDHDLWGAFHKNVVTIESRFQVDNGVQMPDDTLREALGELSHSDE
jgi:hypothetical protein